MGVLYAKDGKIFCNEYIELYVPMDFFESGVAQNRGLFIESLGLLYIQSFKDGKGEGIKLLNIPTVMEFMLYESHPDTIRIQNKDLECLALSYPKDSYIVHQTLPKGREVANQFLDMILAGKLPKTLNYKQVIDIWWTNLEISGISYKVPSKIFEMIIATTYRNPHNVKERYGQLYGRQQNPSGYDYVTENVRSVVKDLSTFSGMIFEDIGAMISNGINNSIEGVEEPVSPLEKIIHY